MGHRAVIIYIPLFHNIVPLCPNFSAALKSAMDELMTGKHGKPFTLLQVITWLSNQLVNPTHPIGRAFERSCRECEGGEGCFLELIKRPKKLKKELEEFLSPGILSYSTALEHAYLGQLPWSQIPLEFMMVWTFGGNRWVVESARPIEIDGFKRVAFTVRSPNGRRFVFISAGGETDRDAEEQGRYLYHSFVKSLKEELPVYVVTLSRENKGTFKPGDPSFIRLHYLGNFLIKKSNGL